MGIHTDLVYNHTGYDITATSGHQLPQKKTAENAVASYGFWIELVGFLFCSCFEYFTLKSFGAAFNTNIEVHSVATITPVSK